jgi:hypothetical protein
MAGDTIDDRTRREQPQNDRRHEHLDVTDDSDVEALDHEAALVGESAETFDPEAPEVDAMQVVDDLPGAVDHPDDYVDE